MRFLLLAALSAHSQGVWHYNGPLYNFGQRAFDGDGASPNGGVVVSPDGSTFYGTTVSGGKYGNGTVFAFSLADNSLQTLWAFGNIPNDGVAPQGNLVLANGILYGTTRLGGYFDQGTAYMIGVDGQNYQVMHSFYGVIPNSGPDGAYPTFAGLTLSGDGSTLYGTTAGGGLNGNGTVFAMSTAIDEFYGYPYQLLHQFTVGFSHDGRGPQAGLILSADGQTLYGTTQGGGAGTPAQGTVFALSTNGDVNGSYEILHSFGATWDGEGDGSAPVAGLVLSADGQTLYGTTGHGGGAGGVALPNGTAFSVSVQGDFYQYTILHVFDDFSTSGLLDDQGNPVVDGICPFAGLVLSGDWLYGTTFYGGAATVEGSSITYGESGSVFAVSTNDNPYVLLSGNSSRYASLNFFAGAATTAALGNDGANPGANLTYQNASPLPIMYGTTTAGGSGGLGAVFSMTEITPPTMSIRVMPPASIRLDFNDPTLTFMLQSSVSPAGPWITMNHVLSPYIGSISTLNFYRLVAFVSNAPVAVTMPATGVSANDATLHGSVLPNAPTAVAWIRYGLDMNYQGGTTPLMLVSAYMANMSMLHNALSGLMPGTLYHYQVVASNAVGLTYGGDQSFTTYYGPQLPTALTVAAVGVTARSATLTGQVTPNGANTRGYFEYGTNIYDSQTVEAVINGTNTNTANLSIGVAMLLPGTVYYFQLVAENSVGTNYGGEQVFATPGPPSTATDAATSITSSGATLNGYVYPNTADTTAWFEYGVDTNYTSGVTGSTVVGAANVTGLSVGIGLSGLSASAIYHFQLVASNSVGTSYGGDQVFYTPGPSPAMVTYAASSITTNTAVLNGSINGYGQADAGYFQYGLDTNYGSSTYSNQFFGTGYLQDYSSSASGLTPSTIYHYRAIGSTLGGLGYGQDMSFTTATPSPTVVTLAATSITHGTAVLNGTVNPNGTSSTVYFEYGTNTSYGGITSQTGVNSAESFNATITGLSANTKYHYRITAFNSGGTSYGSDTNFSTLGD